MVMVICASTYFSKNGLCDCLIILYRFKQMVVALCDQYNTPISNRVSILTNSLESKALDFYLGNIAGRAKNLQEALLNFGERFNSPYPRAQAQSYSESLTLAAIREKERCSTANALDDATKKIPTIKPICVPAFQCESHDARWLAKLLIMEPRTQKFCAN